MVCAVRKASGEPGRIRSYRTNQAGQANYDCTIWEAASATSAAPVYFKEVTLSANGEVWVDGGLGSNNPIVAAVAEVENEPVFATREIGCVLSIGTGRRRKKELSSHYIGVHKDAARMLTDSEDTAEHFAATPQGKQLQGARKYFRFNVTQGEPQLKLDDWDKRGEMFAFTPSYLGEMENVGKVHSCAEVLWDPHQNDPGRYKELVKSFSMTE